MHRLAILILTMSATAVAEPVVETVALAPGVACASCTRLAHKKVKGLGNVEVRVDHDELELRVELSLGPEAARVSAIVLADEAEGHAGSSDEPTKVTAKLRRLKGGLVGVTLTETVVHSSDDGVHAPVATPYQRKILLACDAEACRRVAVGGFYDDCRDARWDAGGAPAVEYACDQRASLAP